MRQTRPSLLLRIRDFGDHRSWGEFTSLYGPLILRCLRGIGLGADDAADLAQDVLRIVVRRIQTFDYDPKIGRFRAWLRRVTVNRARRFFVEKRRRLASPGGTAAQEALQQLPDPTDRLEGLWERQWQRRRLEVAMERVQAQVKPTTWQAFHLNVIQDEPAEAVAERLGIKVGQVYVNKSRVLSRLREAVERIDE